MHLNKLLISGGLAWPLIAGILIILANGFFVAVEFALVTSRRTRLEDAASAGSQAARIVLNMLKDPDRAIAAAQLGITAASILLGIVAEEPLEELIGPVLEPTLGRLISQTAAAAIAAFLVLLILSFFHMVVGEQAPKIIAIRFPERMAQIIALPMQMFARITAPFVWIVDASTTLVLRILGIKGTTGAHGTVASIEELKAMVKQSGQVGLLEEEEQEMVYRVFEFGESVVRDVMVPRTNIVGVDRSQSLADLLEAFREHRHSRFPIYEEDLDHVVGLITMKDLFVYLFDNPAARTATVGDLPIIQEPVRVPESRLVSDLFDEMRSSRTRFAVVIDEFGGTAGLVTIDELVEEIVGQVGQEWGTQPHARRVAENTYEVDAQLNVEEVNGKFGLQLPEADAYKTVAGLILHQLRRIPATGQEVAISNYKLRVLELDGPKITKVRIEAIP